jgi:catechol 2,3-dioxygenase-like lactoylglutathione lyase family enzyme
MAQVKTGIPSLRGIEHVGLTVPDLDEAIDFFVNVIGCEPFYELGPFCSDDDWMVTHLNVHPRAEVTRLKFLRCKFGPNLELFEYSSPDQNKALPKNSDVGGHHFAFYVVEMDAAVAYLRSKDVQVLGEPTVRTEGPSGGQVWVYFLAPWGTQLELVSYPEGKNYENDYEGKLWHPSFPDE